MKKSTASVGKKTRFMYTPFVDAQIRANPNIMSGYELTHNNNHEEHRETAYEKGMKTRR